MAVTPKPPHPDEGAYDPDDYWEATSESYAAYPTIRHRRRWVRTAIARLTADVPLSQPLRVFDHGCGNGQLLAHLSARLPRRPWLFGGCEISRRALDEARRALPAAELHGDLFPKLDHLQDFVVSSEVIEHTRAYRDLLVWMRDSLAPGGHLLVTTQAGRIHASDRYTGHTQHFQRAELVGILEGLGLEVVHARQWGFPFFSAQKFATNIRFEAVRGGVLEGPLTLKKRLLFGIVTAAMYLQDPIPLGPQLYVIARRPYGPTITRNLASGG